MSLAFDTPTSYVREPEEAHPPLDFPAYKYTREDSLVSGTKWVKYDDTKPEVWKVPFFDELVPVISMKVPKGGYVVAPPHAAWVKAKLELHGFKTQLLDKPKEKVTVESFRVVDAKFKTTPYEGRQTVQVFQMRACFSGREFHLAFPHQSQQAFLPVTQQDFDGGRLEHRGPRPVAAVYPGPLYYPCGYYGPCYAYPGFVGFYDGWGRSPGYYGRGGFRH